MGYDFEELKDLVDQLENSELKDRPSIKTKINNWIGNSANLITIGSALYEYWPSIVGVLQEVLNLL